MVTLHTAFAFDQDPLIAVLELNRPVSADVLRAAIVYREAQLDIHRRDIEVLQKALARLLGLPPPNPKLQETARHAVSETA